MEGPVLHLVTQVVTFLVTKKVIKRHLRSLCSSLKDIFVLFLFFSYKTIIDMRIFFAIRTWVVWLVIRSRSQSKIWSNYNHFKRTKKLFLFSSHSLRTLCMKVSTAFDRVRNLHPLMADFHSLALGHQLTSAKSAPVSKVV